MYLFCKSFMCGCLACMLCLNHVHAVSFEARRGHQIALELEFQTVVSCHVCDIYIYHSETVSHCVPLTGLELIDPPPSDS